MTCQRKRLQKSLYYCYQSLYYCYSPTIHFVCQRLYYIQVNFLWHKLSSLSRLERSFNTHGTVCFTIHSLLHQRGDSRSFTSPSKLVVESQNNAICFGNVVLGLNIAAWITNQSQQQPTLQLNKGSPWTYFQRTKPVMATPHITLDVMIYSEDISLSQWCVGITQ